MNLPQETLGLRRPCFSHGSRYSYRHSLFCEVHQCSRSGFNPHTMLLYRCLRIPLLRCRVLAPLHFRRWITRPVSYYALFECVAASKPTSWLSVQSNILFPLNAYLGTLADDLGCSPFDRGTYLSRPDSRIIYPAFAV